MRTSNDTSPWLPVAVVAALAGYVGYLIGAWMHDNEALRRDYESKITQLRYWMRMEIDQESSQAYMSGYNDCLERFQFDRVKYILNGPDKELKLWKILSEDKCPNQGKIQNVGQSHDENAP